MSTEYDCEHPEVEVRYRWASNGVKHYPKQCLRCGANLGNVAKDSMSGSKRALLKPFDEELRQRFSADKREAWLQQHQDQRATWWAEYTAYLSSPEWRARRQLVLERDDYRCQARLEGCTLRAVQVHHVSYEHLHMEPLWELQSVCLVCHDTITEWGRAAREALP